jgi:nitrile hydratase
MGFGAIAREGEEPPFHAVWERRALGLTLCSGALGAWNIDESRHAREALPPAVYYRSSYYEIWILALQTLLLRHELISAKELGAGHAIDRDPKPRQVLKSIDVAPALARGGPCDRTIPAMPKFSAGERVRTRNMHPVRHTRLPRYARDKSAIVETVHRAFVFPDANAHDQGEQPQYVYTIVFEARDLWGEDADPWLRVSIDAWESYLERA